VPRIVEALPQAVEMGLRLPLVYNTSSFDSLDSLRVMDGLVDLYLPDFKLWDEEASRQYLAAVSYPGVAREVIREMHRQVGELKADEDGLALRGLLVRHLVMPGRLGDTREIVGRLAAQSHFADINRRVTRPEMTEAFDPARAAGLWRLDDRWCEVSPRHSLAVSE
jgi:putative pyruvate formate lyase activating enzyme